MSEIGNIIGEVYRKARIWEWMFFMVSLLLIIPPLVYEYDINFVHLQSLFRFGIASVYIILIWTSGFLFGIAMGIRELIRRTRGIF